MICYHVIYRIIYFLDKNKMYSTKISPLLRFHQSKNLFCRSFFNQTYINGQWVSAQSGETFKVYNPSNGEEVGSVPNCNVEDAEKAVQAAYNTFHNKWSIKTGKDRSVIMRKFNDLILKNKDKLAKILTTEMVNYILKRNKSIVFV